MVYVPYSVANSIDYGPIRAEIGVGTQVVVAGNSA